jgi:hypothetical protein
MKKTSSAFAFGCGLTLTLAHAALSPASAAPAASAGEFLACAAEKDDARRLACFDAAAARAGTAADSPSGTATAAPTPAATAATVATATAATATPALSQEERFGLRGDLKEEKAKKAPELAELNELQAQVTQVATKPHGQLVLSLDNGQVWYEIQANTAIRVKVGDKVTIKAGALGSYSLVAPNGRSSKVTRVR